MKHYLAILGWTLGAWLTVTISFSLSFPGAGFTSMGKTSGPSGYSDFTDWLVLFGPMFTGAIALAFGLLGLLPGTDPKDEKDNQD